MNDVNDEETNFDDAEQNHGKWRGAEFDFISVRLGIAI